MDINTANRISGWDDVLGNQFFGGYPPIVDKDSKHLQKQYLACSSVAQSNLCLHISLCQDLGTAFLKMSISLSSASYT
eukprot:425210-Ditylum_brightwellii.AAC.1